MSKAEDLIAASFEEQKTMSRSVINDELVIDGETREINVPESEMLFGVEGDVNIERKHFRCPKIVGDNIDLSKHLIYVAYVYTENQNNSFLPEIGIQSYRCTDVQAEGDDITFSWKLSGNVFKNPGFIAFKVFAKEKEESPLTVFNTVPAFGIVKMTIPDGNKEIAEEYPDIINQLLTKMESVEQIATPEAMQGYVNAYLEENPVTGGMTEEQEQQLNQNTTDVADLKRALPDKLDTNQGIENKGKSMVVGEDGTLVPENIKTGIDVEYISEDEMLVLSGGSNNTDESPESPEPITNDIELLDTIILTPSQKNININLDEYNKKEYFVLVDVPKTENETHFRIGIGDIYILKSPHATNIHSLQVYAIIHKIDVNYYGFATMNDGWSGGAVSAGIIPTPRTEKKYLSLSFYPFVSGDEEAVIKIYGR